MTSKIAFLFPGQGSQRVGMGLELAQAFPSAQDIFSMADNILDLSISSIAWNGPDYILNDTSNTQPALYVHSIAALHVLQEQFPKIQPIVVAGHSMGELTALTASKAISFSDGLRLARRRGELMKLAGEQSQGGMVAIFGIDIPKLEDICGYVSYGKEIVQVANDNCPGQVVISGTNEALERAIPLLQEAGARRIIRLPVSIAAHSSLMRNAEADFLQVINNTPINDPTITVIGNISAQPLTTNHDIHQDLRDQLTHRVRWTETTLLIHSLGVSQFIEIGSGNVLCGLIKRTLPEAFVFSFGNPDDFTSIQEII